MGGLCWQKWLKSRVGSSGEFKYVFILIWGEKLKYWKELRITIFLPSPSLRNKFPNITWLLSILILFCWNISPRTVMGPSPSSPEPFAGADARHRPSITLHVASIVTVILVGKKSSVSLGCILGLNGIRDFRKQMKLSTNYNKLHYLRKSPIRTSSKWILKAHDHSHVCCGPVIFILQYTNCDKIQQFWALADAQCRKIRIFPLPAPN